MKNVFCTLAMGETYAGHASFIVADLEVYKVPTVIVTDAPQFFKKFKHVHVIEHRPAKFSYHDKRIALKEALRLGETAIFVDADSAIWFGADRRMVRDAVNYSFPPGLHAGKLYPADVYPFPHTENLGKEWGLKFDRNVICYWEGLFALTRDPRVEQFFKIWDKFAEEAKARDFVGSGEGACFGIAAEASELPRYYTTYMMQSNLPYVMWHTRLAHDKRRLFHMKFGLKEMLKGNLNLHQHCWAI